MDVKIVVPAGEAISEGIAKALAEAIAAVLRAPEGKVWVRVEPLVEGLYAENGSGEGVHPVFIKVLHADLPPREELAVQALAICQAVSGCLGRKLENTYVEYALAGRGRVAFGGRLPQ